MEKQTGMKIKALHTDNGREYLSKEFDKLLNKEGIKRRLTVPYTPQQNGVAERYNRILVEMTRCMIFQSGLSPSFWAEAVCTANHVRNRCPTEALNGRTPFEFWHQKLPNLSHLQIFGTKVFVLNEDPCMDKLAPRSREGVFVGYCGQSKAFRVWMINERKICITRDMRVISQYENEGNGGDVVSSHTTCGQKKILTGLVDSDNEIEEAEIPHKISEKSTIEIDEEQPAHKRDPGRPKIIKSGLPGRPPKEYNIVRSTRSTTKSTSSDDTAHQSARINVQNMPNIIVSDVGDDDVFEETTRLATCENEAKNEHANEYAFNAEINFQEAMKSPEHLEWRNAIVDEVKSLVKNDTWQITKMPEKRNIVGCRFVLTDKYSPKGILERRKGRLVAQGFSQKPGVDYNGTFAPVAKLDSIRMMLALSAKFELIIHQIDITTAYLNGSLNETIYMKKPPLLSEILQELIQTESEKSDLSQKAKIMLNDMKHDDSVCKLNKSLYGLKQAGRQWNLKLNSKLLRMGLKATCAEPCIYFAWKNNTIMPLSVYVDDILISSKDLKWINDIKCQLRGF